MGRLEKWRHETVTKFEATRRRVRRWVARGDLDALEDNQFPPLPATTDIDGWKEVVRSRAPFLSSVLRLRQQEIRAILKLHRRWLEDDGVPLSPAQARWIYALLGCLDRLIDAETAACLRGLCRGTALAADPAASAAAQVILTLVAVYFGQHDLLDAGLV